MPPARKKRTAARRKNTGSPAWLWLLAGILIGLGLAWYLFSRGYIPQPRVEDPVAAESASQAPAVDDEEVAPAPAEEDRPRYDFFTVLPEMEVVVPEQELSDKGQAQAAAPSAQRGSYLLQVGSFREVSDAEELKARLALLGMVARVQTVTVNDATWHRVRVGPVQGARQAEDLRQRLTSNGIDSLVLQNPD
jgi:cell division protein FtsN